MTTPTVAPHCPVLLAEVLAAVAPAAGERIIDATFGAGGYSGAILDAADCEVFAFDRDPTAIAAAAPLVARYAPRLRLVEETFADMERALADELRLAEVRACVDAVVLDIGVSSMQIDAPERGFSFQHDGPLDMRMSRGGRLAGPSAADVVNTASETELADIFFHLGEERKARLIARAIVKDRVERKPFTRTAELASLVQRLLKAPKIDGRHAATRTFQALRIHVNDELGQLARALSAAERLLKPGGRLAVVTFHSLEDRIVKRFLQVRTGRLPRGSRHLPVAADAGPAPSFRFVNHRSVNPSEQEIASNPRARSARLRWAVRTGAGAFAEDLADLELPLIG
jgi:16S rRNA (cytosine1402-N4)-methyltransferase